MSKKNRKSNPEVVLRIVHEETVDQKTAHERMRQFRELVEGTEALSWLMGTVEMSTTYTYESGFEETSKFLGPGQEYDFTGIGTGQGVNIEGYDFGNYDFGRPQTPPGDQHNPPQQ